MMNPPRLSLAPCLAALLCFTTAQAQQSPSPPAATAGSPAVGASASAVALSGGILTQTLGPWELTAPDSASTIIFTGGSFGWLNIVNVPLDVSQAMGSSPIESAGFANPNGGDVIEVVFNGGVTNRVGADLVMLDSQYDVGVYEISSDFDGFSATVSVDTGFGTNVASESYWYLGAGPYPAFVMGVEVDLSSIGVPSGASVTALRFTCMNSGCDPISLAKIDGGLELSVSALTAGAFGTFEVTGATPLGNVGVAYSLAGTGPTTLSTGFCGSLTLDLSPPIAALFVLPADGSGDLSITTSIPAGASGVTINFQAVDVGSCEVSNGVTTTVL